jgi:hypothetical protein
MVRDLRAAANGPERRAPRSGCRGLVKVIMVVLVLAVSSLALYAMHRSKPSRLKLSASLLKLASFSIEIESQDGRQGSELPPSGTRQG